MLPKQNRLTSQADFKDLFKSGRKWSGSFLFGFIKEEEISDPLFGFIVSNKISKSAASRNQIKRWMREAVQQFLSKIKNNYKITLVAKKEAIDADFIKIEAEIKRFLEESNLLK